jgi:hypothetical protein
MLTVLLQHMDAIHKTVLRPVFNATSDQQGWMEVIANTSQVRLDKVRLGEKSIGDVYILMAII